MRAGRGHAARILESRERGHLARIWSRAGLDGALDRPRSGRLNLAQRFSAGSSVRKEFLPALAGGQNII